MQYSDEDSDHSNLDNLQTGSHIFGLGSAETSQSENIVTDPLSGGEPEREDPRAASQAADSTETENPKDLVGALSLRSRTLASLAETFVRDRELDEDALSKAQMLPDFWPAVKAALYNKADSLKGTPKTLQLMYQSLRQETDVDLGSFSAISIPDLAIVLDRISHGGQMQTLNLSGRSTLTKNELEFLIKHTKALQAIYLMGARSSLSVSDLTKLQFPGDMYHHMHLERALHPEVGYESPTELEVKPAMLEFLPVEHCLRHIAYVTVPDCHISTRNCNLATSGIDWSDLSAEGSEPTDQHTYEQLENGKRCRKYPLTDTPMPLSRLVIGLRNLFEW